MFTLEKGLKEGNNVISTFRLVSRPEIIDAPSTAAQALH